MPIYRYKCLSCEHEFEQLYLSFSAAEREEETEPCPKCAAVNKERLINKSTSFLLKGGGWAKDRYGGGSSGNKSGR